MFNLIIANTGNRPAIDVKLTIDNKEEFTECIDKITIVYGSGSNSPTPDPDNSKIIIGGQIFEVEQCGQGCECLADDDNDGVVANNVADNYILMIIDNGSYGSTGDQPTYTGKKTDLAGIARAAGCDNVIEVRDVDTGPALQAAIDSKQGTVMVVKCDSGNAKMPVITMDPVIIKDRFMKAIAG